MIASASLPKRTIFFLLFLVSLLLLAGLSGCGGGNSTPPPPPTFVASVSPTSLSFGSQATGSTSAAQSVTLTNTGTGALSITSIAASGPFTQTNNCGATLNTGSNCKVQVSFAPTTSGDAAGTLTIADNATAGAQSVSLSGTGVAPTFIASLAPGSLSFSPQVVNTASAAQSLTLTNTGTADLSITSIVASGPFTQTNTCGATLPAGGNCKVQVVFAPSLAGDATGMLTVTDNATAGPQVVALSGTGVAATFIATLTPGTLSFGSQLVNSTSAAQALTLTNTGNSELNISSIAATAPFAQTSNCGATLAAAAICQIMVTFAPTTAGDAAGSVTVMDTATAGPQSATLSGTGTLPPVVVTVHPTLAAVAASWQTQTFASTVTGGSGNTAVTWSVDGVAGGDASVGSISSDGVYTPPATGGSHSIRATSVDDNTKSASATVGVTDLAGVTTYHYNATRDGTNQQEYALTPGVVTTSKFGKLFSCAVDGVVYAQPLWLPGLAIAGGQHNVLFVATQHGSLYAFDADAKPCNQLWHVNLLDTAHGAAAGEAPVGTFDVGNGFQDIQPEVCVTGTPVIDPASGTLYLVTKSKDASFLFHQRLHAIDIFTGAEKLAGPVEIAAQVPGSGDGSSGGMLVFSPRNQHQRAGLALANGMVYISWASHEDHDPYHGWVIAYDAASLTQRAVFNTSPDGGRSGVWMAGGAPAVDEDGNLYFTTGNGTFDAENSSGHNMDLGDSVLRVTPSLAVADSFTPFNQDSLNNFDLDVSSSGLLLLPEQSSGLMHLLITSSKEGRIYLLNRDNMGLFCSGCGTDMNAVQSLLVGGEDFGTPAFWQNRLYYASSDQALQLYTFDPVKTLLSSSPASQSKQTFHFPGPVPAVSSGGAANGVLWGLEVNAYGVPSSFGSGPAVLHAFDATDVSNELWNSGQAAANRDKAGAAVKFTVPTVANGKVYVGTRTEVDVYGILPN